MSHERLTSRDAGETSYCLSSVSSILPSSFPYLFSTVRHAGAAKNSNHIPHCGHSVRRGMRPVLAETDSWRLKGCRLFLLPNTPLWTRPSPKTGGQYGQYCFNRPGLRPMVNPKWGVFPPRSIPPLYPWHSSRHPS